MTLGTDLKMSIITTCLCVLWSARLEAVVCWWWWSY